MKFCRILEIIQKIFTIPFYFSKFLNNLIDRLPKIHYNIKKASGVILVREQSYTEFMKSGAMNRKKLKEAYVLNLYIDMILSEALLQSEKERLSKRIDKAIDEQDKKTFLQLSTKYKELNKKFGT